MASFAAQVAAEPPTADESSHFAAWYEFTHPGGAFEICLRPGGVLYAPGFPAPGARWAVAAPDRSRLALSWGKYGDYELALADAATRAFAGSKVANPADWRRMRPVRPLSAAEALLLGAGGHGSQWSFQWAGGAFPVEFKGDVYNHFSCAQFPAHSHWSLGGAAGDELTINWANYGTYELRVNGAARAGDGSLAGTPSDWRKMAFVADLEPAAAAAEGCGHDHDHQHGPGCGH